MLEIRPNCECCNKDLPAHSDQAMICSYECTFCARCVTEILENVCPNCGGNFSPRPIRPAIARRKDTSIAHQPASTERVHTPYSIEAIKLFVKNIKSIKPEGR